MGQVSIVCPKCAKRYTVAEDKIGDRARCAECKEVFVLSRVDTHEERRPRQAPLSGQESAGVARSIQQREAPGADTSKQEAERTRGVAATPERGGGDTSNQPNSKQLSSAPVFGSVIGRCMDMKDSDSELLQDPAFLTGELEVAVTSEGIYIIDVMSDAPAGVRALGCVMGVIGIALGGGIGIVGGAFFGKDVGDPGAGAAVGLIIAAMMGGAGLVFGTVCVAQIYSHFRSRKKAPPDMWRLNELLEKDLAKLISLDSIPSVLMLKRQGPKQQLVVSAFQKRIVVDLSDAKIRTLTQLLRGALDQPLYTIPEVE